MYYCAYSDETIHKRFGWASIKIAQRVLVAARAKNKNNISS
jgi:hypothetical protein